MSLLSKIVDIIYPQKCVLCQKLGECAVCSQCRSLLSKARVYPFGVRTFSNGLSCYYLYDYNDENVKKMLLYAKRHNDRLLFEFFAKEAESLFLREYENGKYTPCHIPRRIFAEIKYGFDQAKSVLTLLCKAAGTNYSPLLYRRAFSRQQKSLNLAKRERNMKKSLYVKKRAPKNVLIYDDIITTGTSAVCAYKVLRKNGARNVKFIFLASKN